ncbi:MAG: hypothetical protein Q7T54_04860 [Candidatus Levybacteria bacterium]|nr:hypothetical protein [Candidatus Levybacteria bacterium]
MKKLFAALLFFPIFFIFANTSHAQTSVPIANDVPQEKTTAYPLNTNPDVPQNFHTYTQNVFIEVLSTATCFVGGVDMLNPDEKCLGIDPVTKKIGYVENGAGLASIMGGMIGGTFNIPVSTSHYGQYLASHFGITKNSLAAFPAEEGGGTTVTGFGKGIGFVGLTPVLDIWKTFRNLTYLLFVFIFILLGLGIMFRVNIDARSIMTIQNQIPKIIIGLVLITLSYAIAGFLIDMMYVGIYLVIHIFESQGLTTMTNIDTNPVSAMGSLGGINGIAAPAAQGVGGMVSSLFSGSIGSWIGMVVTGIIGSFIGGSLFGGFGGLIGGAIGAIVGLVGGTKILGLIAMAIAYLIISVAVFTSLFRVWFMLIKAYIFIFLDVIFAPFWIIGGLLPGAPGGVGPWIRSLIANLAAFPAVVVLFMIGKTMQDQAFNTSGTFVPPLIGNPGTSSGDAIASILGLGIILIMPEAVTITKSTLKAPELKYTAAIGKAIGQGQGYVSKPIGGAWKELMGEKRDGSKGILRSTIDDQTMKVGGKVARAFKLNKTPIGKRIEQKVNARRAHERRMRGEPESEASPIATGPSQAKKRFGLFRSKSSQPTTHSPSLTPVSDAQVEAEARRMAMRQGIVPDHDTPEVKQAMESFRNQARTTLGSQSGIIATEGSTEPLPSSGATGNGGGSGGRSGINITLGGPSAESVEAAAREGAAEGVNEALGDARGEGPSSGGGGASDRSIDAGLARADEDEKRRREGGGGSPPQNSG